MIIHCLEVDIDALEWLPESDPIGPSDVGLSVTFNCARPAPTCLGFTCGFTNNSGTMNGGSFSFGAFFGAP